MKILIVHASAGAGHTKAAEAIAHGLEKASSHRVVLVDALDYTSPFYKDVYQKGYTFLITKISWLWGFFFWALDIPFLLGVVRVLRRFFNALNAKKFHRFLEQEQFDVIFSTHFFPNEVASYLKRTGKITSQINCIVTDYDAHSIWTSTGIDYYAVACDYTKNKLCALGVDRERILVTGIPTDKKFSKGKNISELKTQLGIQKDKLTVLIATGSFGIGPIEEIVNALEGYQVLVVCGRNKALYKKLSEKHLSYAVIYGHVNNMHELMAVSDCMVTKPGGLSISEALVSRLPLIFFNAIPGQEENNVRVLKGMEIGINSHGHVDVIVEEIKKLARSPNYFQHMREKVNVLARPHAVDDIIQMI